MQSRVLNSVEECLLYTCLCGLGPEWRKASFCEPTLGFVFISGLVMQVGHLELDFSQLLIKYKCNFQIHLFKV